MTEKVFKVFLARLEESAYYFGIHKNDVWKEQLEKAERNFWRHFRNSKRKSND